MTTTTLLIIILVILVVSGGGWYWPLVLRSVDGSWSDTGYWYAPTESVTMRLVRAGLL
jgi:hypothetical protein